MPEAHEELHELQEHAEHAQHETTLAPVSLSMAVLAVLVAVITLLGHRTHTEEILLQTKVTDQWAYYNSKATRRDLATTSMDLLSVMTLRDAEKAEKLREKYQASLERERDRGTEIQTEARGMEKEIAMEERLADRFDFAEGLLEAALVITSITLLTRKRGFWFVGLVVAAAGLMVAGSALFVHL
jgi:ElaB/YqjD/DUF883 family membrane-anchored ribosome-binding protein